MRLGSSCGPRWDRGSKKNSRFSFQHVKCPEKANDRQHGCFGVSETCVGTAALCLRKGLRAGDRPSSGGREHPNQQCTRRPPPCLHFYGQQKPYTWFRLGEMVLEGGCHALALAFLGKTVALLPPGLQQQEKVSRNRIRTETSPSTG